MVPTFGRMYLSECVCVCFDALFDKTEPKADKIAKEFCLNTVNSRRITRKFIDFTTGWRYPLT